MRNKMMNSEDIKNFIKEVYNRPLMKSKSYIVLDNDVEYKTYYNYVNEHPVIKIYKYIKGNKISKKNVFMNTCEEKIKFGKDTFQEDLDNSKCRECTVIDYYDKYKIYTTLNKDKRRSSVIKGIGDNKTIWIDYLDDGDIEISYFDFNTIMKFRCCEI